jgi:hypothetical protein
MNIQELLEFKVALHDDIHELSCHPSHPSKQKAEALLPKAGGRAWPRSVVAVPLRHSQRT